MFEDYIFGGNLPALLGILNLGIDLFIASKSHTYEFCAEYVKRGLHEKVIVRRLAEEEISKGGIIIPDSAKEKPAEGEIIAVGNGRVSDDGKVTPLDVKKGDKVLFSKYSGTEVKVDGEELLIMGEDNILAVIE